MAPSGDRRSILPARAGKIRPSAHGQRSSTVKTACRPHAGDLHRAVHGGSVSDVGWWVGVGGLPKFHGRCAVPWADEPAALSKSTNHAPPDPSRSDETGRVRCR